jgi:hypothetical protein|tara:strand:- start:285 stop:596 length:312 start_codon:yes stop_codon:yes gene_type:complete
MKDLITKSNDILQEDLLDREEQETLKEISIGKLSTTLFIGRMKGLTNKIKDIPIRKSLMNLGYMVYTVSLQSKSLKNIEDSLNKVNQQLQKQQQDIQRLNNKR